METKPQPPKLTVHAHRLGHLTAGIEARTWETTLAITGQEPVNAPAPTEALIGALAACMIAGIEREGKAAGLTIPEMEATAHAVKIMTEKGPLLTNFSVEVAITSPEPDEKLIPILEALRHNGSVTNTIQMAQPIEISYEIKHPQA